MIRIEFSGLLYPRYYIRLVGDSLEPCRNLIQVTRMGIHIYVERERERARERERESKSRLLLKNLNYVTIIYIYIYMCNK